jgi:DNA repair protein SbcD/Mre11
MPAPPASSDSPSSGAPATLRLLHTSDLQLDAPFAFLGEKGVAHRQQLRATFSRIAELARQGGYSLLLIAGDLFNDNRPSRSSLDLVRETLAALPIPVCILPGNHDCYDRASVYRREAFPANVHILTETPSVMDFPELDLAVSGNAVLSRHSTESGLRGITGINATAGLDGTERRHARRWHVVMAHGNVCIPGRVQDPERPILPEEIAACGADYVALGDWHAFASYSQATVPAFYSGAPEPTSLDAAGSGFVASITLSDRGVAVEPVRVGRTETVRLSIDITGRSECEIIGLIRQQAKPTLMLDVVLRGMAAVDQVIDPERVVDESAGGFYWLRVTNQSHLELAHLDPADYPETQVIGQYVRMLTRRIQTAANEVEKSRTERALQLGVALLRGQETLA